MARDDLLITCEHGGNRVPAGYRHLFAGRGAERALRSHRGWDPGAIDVALALVRRTGAPLHEARTTRLLVELNRSPHHGRLFSEFSGVLSRDERAALLATHYFPYRDGVEQAIRQRLETRRVVLHLSVHTFAGTWQGLQRAVDIGLLYDPARPGERRLCAKWQARLWQIAPDLRVRRNYPYRGVADGLVTYLRRQFGLRRYVAIELEVSQSLVAAPGNARRRVIDVLARSLLAAVD